MHSALLFLMIYTATVIAERMHQMLEAGTELEWRAQGSRRAFRLIDWTPSP